TAYQFEASGPFTASGNIEGIGLGGYPSCNEYITEPCQELWDVNFTGQGTVYLDGGFTQTPDGLAGGAVDGLSLTFEPTPELATLPLVFTGLAVLFMLGERNRLRRLPGAEK
ncbi:MAG: hypothetical protein ACRD22_04850, partial [Terriglobia bacterium]